MNGEAFLSLLQFSDGLFPAGSYAHSFGLETYAAERTVRDAEGVERFLLSYLQGSVAPTDAVAALASRKAAALSHHASRMEQCVVIDHRLDAMKPVSELRDASRQMGRQVLRIAAHMGGPFASRGLTAELFDAVEKGQTPGHHAMAFGVVGAALGWPETEMARAYLYSSCAGLLRPHCACCRWGSSPGSEFSGPCRHLSRGWPRKFKARIWLTFGVSPRELKLPPCATRLSMRGCSDRDSQTAQNWDWGAGGVGQDCPGRGTVHAFSAQ